MKKTIQGGLILLIILVLASSAMAMEVFPLEELQPGMHGKGKTVVQGTQVEDFFVEVISVIPQAPPTPPLVMVRVSGDVIERSGGIAAGMSGSPVYIDDKLLGAIGYGYAQTDHRVGLVTPARPMMDLMTSVKDSSDSYEVDLPEGVTPLKTPLLVGGISGRPLEMLSQGLANYNFEVMPALAGTTDQDVSLEPGSAFGVQLMRGDFQAVSFGTITHVENERFVGFGHPFTHQGEVDFFVTPAFVHYTMPSIEFPFKIASAGPTIGSLLQDRAPGVAGVLDQVPGYLPVTLNVIDKDRKMTKEFTVETVREDSLILPLVVSSVYQGIDATLDRIGRGSAYVRIEFNGKNLPHRIVRENVYYSESDIAIWTLFDLIEGLELLLSNRFQAVDLTSVKVDVEVERQRNTATIEKAIPLSSQVRPGETVDVEVSLRPYRGVVETRILRIAIPEDTLPGLMTVSVRSGGSGYYDSRPTIHTSLQPSEEDDDEEEEETRDNPTGGESLEMLLDEFVNRERNSEIVAEYYPFIDHYATEPATADFEDSEEDESGETAPEEPVATTAYDSPSYGYGWDAEANEPIRVRLATKFIVDGMATFDLDVVADEETP